MHLVIMICEHIANKDYDSTLKLLVRVESSLSFHWDVEKIPFADNVLVLYLIRLRQCVERSIGYTTVTGCNWSQQ